MAKVSNTLYLLTLGCLSCLHHIVFYKCQRLKSWATLHHYSTQQVRISFVADDFTTFNTTISVSTSALVYLHLFLTCLNERLPIMSNANEKLISTCSMMTFIDVSCHGDLSAEDINAWHLQKLHHCIAYIAQLVNLRQLKYRVDYNNISAEGCLPQSLMVVITCVDQRPYEGE